MPRQSAVHYNIPGGPAIDNGKARCGRLLRNVIFSEDKDKVTCRKCEQLLSLDEGKPAQP